ncbi:MAG: TRAP transporter substrate-binding protein [Rhodobacterales bacterium]|uniref:TRAP transporter substrate-binding protein n=1 Tax=Gemmobacter nectariphilus TaxID=220343 RepID=UPI0004851934|nr:TRAP transporter substrate-binding protein [Gemmobacter nectariphilus]MDX5358988.1 TRAP transporter substrate-binding protein [Rhodobacterales bacterium]MDX5501203.1 TRAP transporter substrate-binding protein [Rhodobacterales bacterium]
MTRSTRRATALLAYLALTGAAVADPVTLRLSHWLPPTHPIVTQSIEPWAKAVTEASGGTITFEMFPAAQLGKAEDHYDLARDGIADMAWLNPGFNPGRFTAFAAVQVPMTVSDGMGGIAALNEWYPEYAASEMSDVHFCLAHMLSPLIVHSKTRVERPSDLRGMKIRPSSAMEALFIRNFGGSTVPGGNPEAREMLDRGIIDGTTGVVGSQFVFKTIDSVKYHLDVPFSAVSFVMVMNPDTYAGMDDAQKAVIGKFCSGQAATTYFAAPQTFEDEGFRKLRGMTDTHEVVTPSPEALAEWKAGAQAVETEWAKEATSKGLDPAAIRQKLHGALAAHNAAVN